MARKLIREGTSHPTIQIAPETKGRFTDWLQANDKPQGKTVGKVIDWFLDQDELVQTVILKRGEDLGSFALPYADYLERSAKELREKNRSKPKP